MTSTRWRPKCVHFNGIQNTCAAGLDPMSFRDTSGKGMATFPCLDLGKPCAAICPQRRVMTDEEQDAEHAELMAAVAKFEADLASGACPTCQKKIEKRERVGRCEYARPCGHRLGQVGGGEIEP